MHRSTRRWTWLGLLAGMAACAEAPTAPGPAPAFLAIVSDATVRSPATSAPMSPAAANVSSLDPVAYVSLAPGSVPGGTTATIRDLRSGLVVAVTLVDGGFDPVAVAALGGDTLAISVTLSTGGLSLAKAVVPVRHPPRVVRTDPPHGRTDVAINATIVVIFSEPIDLTTLTSESIRLLKGNELVPGVIRPDSASAVRVEFVPAQPLSSGAAYQLVLTNTIADRTGDRLDGALTSDFQTASGSIKQLTLVFASQPSSGFVGDPMWVQIAVQNSLHNTVTAFTGQVTLTLHAWSDSPNGGASTGSRELATAAAVNGQATFGHLVLPAAGTYRLEATGTQLKSAMGQPFVTCVPECEVWKTFIPTPRGSVGGGVIDGVIYVVGGGYISWVVDDSVLATVEAYDLVTNTWSTRAPMPTARRDLQAGVVNGILYAVGGAATVDGVQSLLATVEAFDPASNTWTARAPLPEPRTRVGIAVVGGILYAIGGWNASGPVPTVDAYDPAMNTWTPRASLPTLRPGAGTAAVNGLIYVAGSQPLLNAYNPATDSWSTLAATPSGSAPSCAAGHAGRLYVKGPDSMFEYEPASDTWTEHPETTTPSGLCDGFMASTGDLLIFTRLVPALWAYHP